MTILYMPIFQIYLIRNPLMWLKSDSLIDWQNDSRHWDSHALANHTMNLANHTLNMANHTLNLTNHILNLDRKHNCGINSDTEANTPGNTGKHVIYPESPRDGINGHHGVSMRTRAKLTMTIAHISHI